MTWQNQQQRVVQVAGECDVCEIVVVLMAVVVLEVDGLQFYFQVTALFQQLELELPSACARTRNP